RPPARSAASTSPTLRPVRHPVKAPRRILRGSDVLRDPPAAGLDRWARSTGAGLLGEGPAGGGLLDQAADLETGQGAQDVEGGDAGVEGEAVGGDGAGGGEGVEDAEG